MSPGAIYLAKVFLTALVLGVSGAAVIGAVLGVLFGVMDKVWSWVEGL